MSTRRPPTKAAIEQEMKRIFLLTREGAESPAVQAAAETLWRSLPAARRAQIDAWVEDYYGLDLSRVSPLLNARLNLMDLWLFLGPGMVAKLIRIRRKARTQAVTEASLAASRAALMEILELAPQNRPQITREHA